MAVPCRRSAAARIDCAHLDLGAALWTIPAAHARNRDAHLHTIGGDRFLPLPIVVVPPC